MQVEARPARARIAVAVGVLRPDVAEKPGEQRLVDRAVARSVDRRWQLRLRHPAELRELVRELRVDVAPFGEPQVRHELRATRLDEPAVRKPLGEPRPGRTPTARGTRGSPSARRGTAGAPRRPPAASRAADRADREPTARSRSRAPRPCSGDRARRRSSGPRADRPAAARARARATSARAPDRPRPAPAAAGSRRRSRAATAARRTETRRPPSRPSAAMRRITAASELRRISGSVYGGRAAKSSSPYSRTQTPSATRPQRPARCVAAACEIFSTWSSVVLLRSE